MLERPRGYGMPVLANLFATHERCARSLGTTVAEFNRRWSEALAHQLEPVLVEDGPVQEVVLTGSDVDASRLPIARHFAGDAGRYLPSGMWTANDPDTGVPNMSFHRALLKGPRRFACSLHSRAHLWDYQRRCEERGKDLEVAVVVGAHPALYMAAASKTGIDVNEMAIAGGLLGRPVEVVRCKTVDVMVPASAELVLEGRILAGEHEDEGPFGEYTGYSTANSTRNVFEVSAVTMRRDALFLDIIPGNSAEHLLLCRVSKQAHVWNRLREVVPTVKALSIPQSGTLFHAYLSLKKTMEGQARHALMLLFGLDPYLKLAVAVDEDIDVHDEAEVLWAIATRTQADRNRFTVPSVFCNRLDPSQRDGMGAKLGIDATVPLDWNARRCVLPPEAVTAARALLQA
jgi:UbiD family decarboxylase